MAVVRAVRNLPVLAASQWVPDDARDSCARCQIKFSLFCWRHHCRFCGHLYCDTCAPLVQVIFVNQPNQLSLDDTRCCAACRGLLTLSPEGSPKPGPSRSRSSPALPTAGDFHDDWVVLPAQSPIESPAVAVPPHDAPSLPSSSSVPRTSKRSKRRGQLRELTLAAAGATSSSDTGPPVLIRPPPLIPPPRPLQSPLPSSSSSSSSSSPSTSSSSSSSSASSSLSATSSPSPNSRSRRSRSSPSPHPVSSSPLPTPVQLPPSAAPPHLSPHVYYQDSFTELQSPPQQSPSSQPPSAFAPSPQPVQPLPFDALDQPPSYSSVIAAKTAAAGAATESAHLLCQNRHQMQIGSNRYQSACWHCDVCKLTYPEAPASRWVCGPCAADICMRCAPLVLVQQGKASGASPDDHSLAGDAADVITCIIPDCQQQQLESASVDYLLSHYFAEHGDVLEQPLPCLLCDGALVEDIAAHTIEVHASVFSASFVDDRPQLEQDADERFDMPSRLTGEYIVSEVKEASQEMCSICFEDFEIGSKRALLDCFCRYHAHCISAWYQKKGERACPHHFVNKNG